MKKTAYLWMLIAVVSLLAGCKAPKRLVSSEELAPSYLASRLLLTLPGKEGGSLSLNGTMRLKSRERIQVSLLMPLLRTEIARIELTPEGVLLVDRMNKRFVRATTEELKRKLPRNAGYAQLEKILLDASLPGGKAELTGRDVGLSSLERAKVELYEFSTKEFSISPTELGSNYRQVPLEELMKLLIGLL